MHTIPREGGHGNESYNTNTPSASLVFVIRNYLHTCAAYISCDNYSQITCDNYSQGGIYFTQSFFIVGQPFKAVST